MHAFCATYSCVHQCSRAIMAIPQHCSNGFISESAPHSRRLKMKVMQTKLIPKLGVWSFGGGGGRGGRRDVKKFRFVLHVGVIS